MAQPICEVEGITVILVGHFNPALVQPAWLARNQLVRDAEANSADIQLIRSELSLFQVGPFTIQVELERFVVSIVDIGQAGPLRDLIVSIFALLNHTPVSQLGLNRMMHFRMPSEETYQRVGNVLVPKEPWTELLREPGVRSVTMLGKRPESAATRVQVTVEPSIKVMPRGIYVAVNEHFELGAQDAAPAMAALTTNWDAALVHARRVADAVVQVGIT